MIIEEKKKENKLLDTVDLEEKEKDSVTHLWKPRLITGGKGPPGHNWLSGLSEGTVFLVKPKATGGFALGQFHLLHKLDKACHLMDNLQTETHIWVDPAAFSSQFDLVTVLFEPNQDGSS